MRRPGSEDPHWREHKFSYYIFYPYTNFKYKSLSLIKQKFKVLFVDMSNLDNILFLVMSNTYLPSNNILEMNQKVPAFTSPRPIPTQLSLPIFGNYGKSY